MPSAPDADGDLLEANAVALRERVAQAVRAAVGIAVQLGGARSHRLERCGKRAERPFVRRQLDDPLEPELALDLFDRLARLVGDRGLRAQAGRNPPGTSPTLERPIRVGHFRARARARRRSPRRSTRSRPCSARRSRPARDHLRAFLLAGVFMPSRRASRESALRRLMIPIRSPFFAGASLASPEPLRGLRAACPDPDEGRRRRGSGRQLLAPASACRTGLALIAAAGPVGRRLAFGRLSRCASDAIGVTWALRANARIARYRRESCANGRMACFAFFALPAPHRVAFPLDARASSATSGMCSRGAGTRRIGAMDAIDRRGGVRRLLGDSTVLLHALEAGAADDETGGDRGAAFSASPCRLPTPPPKKEPSELGTGTSASDFSALRCAR